VRQQDPVVAHGGQLFGSSANRSRLVLAHWSMKQRPRARNESSKSTKQSKRCSSERGISLPQEMKTGAKGSIVA